jgi:hypothetical protein
MQQTTACDALYIAVTALFNRRDKCATAWKPAAVNNRRLSANSLTAESIYICSKARSHPHPIDRAMVPTTQIGLVVAQHRDCFSIGNHHFFASNNDLILLNSLLLSCGESGKCWWQNCHKCAS